MDSSKERLSEESESQSEAQSKHYFMNKSIQ
jgi:hypothetical protein